MNSPLCFLMRYRRVIACSAALLTLSSCTPPSSNESAPDQREVSSRSRIKPKPLPIEETLIVVAPNGNDAGDGTLSQPLSTLNAAIQRVTTDRDTIVLRGGLYTQPVNIRGEGDRLPPMTIRSHPGEEVIFDGSAMVERWESAGSPGLYYIEAPGRETYGMHQQMGYYEVWEDEARLRYRKVLDREGVAAWPGSVCIIDDTRLLVHIPDGRDPGEAKLRRGKEATIFSVSRSNVTVEGIAFQNIVGGGEARALTASAARGITIRDCHFTNCSIGISNAANETVIEDCTFTEVGLGIRFSGRGSEMTARRCVIESALGHFAFSDMSEHLRNGFRIYHAGDGARIEQCVTTGFWAGLYIKTISHRDGSKPFYIEDNTFLDGFRSGADHRQPRTFVRRNIIGANVEETGVMANGGYLRKMGATLEQNYFYGWGGKPEGNDMAGPMPFNDPAQGDLSLRSDVTLPTGVATVGAASLKHVEWTRSTTAALTPTLKEAQQLAQVGETLLTASEHGALVVIDFNQPVTGTLRWRAVGETGWRAVPGKQNTVIRPASMAAMAPVGPEIHDRYSLIFPLMGTPLTPGAEYECRVAATARAGGSLELADLKFTPTSGTKLIHVQSDAKPNGNGSEAAPLGDLQQAFNRALPGDTIILGAGVLTKPAILHHGGTAEAPLTIRGQGPEKTILDGGKQAGTLVEMRQAAHVHFHGVQIRWFGNHGLHALGSPYGRLENCRILNQALNVRFGRSGNGFLLKNSPGWVVTGSTFNTMEHGMLVVESPQFTAHHNTSYANLYSGLALIESSRDSKVTYNSFNFTGNDSLVIREKQREAFETLQLDYNNYGTMLWKVAEIDRGGTVIKTEGRRPENDFTPPARYGFQGGSKFMMSAVLNGEHHSFFRLGDWQKFTGKDAHSIFADPMFAAPTQGDFRLLPGTPNRLTSGEVIGSGAVLESAPTAN